MSKPLYLTPADEALIPPSKRALYRAGILSKEELDTFIGESAKSQLAAEEARPKQANMAAPQQQQKQTPSDGYTYLEMQRDPVVGLYSGAGQGALALGNLAAQTALYPQEKLAQAYEWLGVPGAGTLREGVASLSGKASELTGKGREAIREKARSFRSEDVNESEQALGALLDSEDFKKKDVKAQALDVLGFVQNNKKLIPYMASESGGSMLVGGPVSRAVGVVKGAGLAQNILARLGPSSVLAGQELAGIQADVYNTVFSQTGDETKAREAANKASTDPVVLAAAGLDALTGAEATSLMTGARRTARQTLAQTAARTAAETIKGGITEAAGEGIQEAAQARAENLAMGRPEWQGVAGQATLGAIVGGPMGAAMSGISSVQDQTQGRKALSDNQSRARQTLTERMAELQRAGLSGTELTSQLAQDATQISANLGLNAKDVFNAKDIVPESTEVDQRIREKVVGNLAQNVRLRPEDPFTVGQMQAMQNIDLEKPFQKDGLKTSYKPLQATEALYLEPTTVEEGSFNVEAPVKPQPVFGVDRKQEFAPATQPEAKPVIGKTRANLTAKMADMKVTDQRISTPESKVELPKKQPKVTQITATEGLSSPKRMAQDNIFGLIQKTAAKEGALTKGQQKALEGQKRRIQQATDEAERQLSFDDAFNGLDQDKQEQSLRRKSLEFLSSGKKIEDISAEFDAKTADKPTAQQARLSEAEQFLTESDETRNRIAKDVGSPDLVDNLIKNQRIAVVPDFKGKTVNGAPVPDEAQAFVIDGDRVVVNASKLGAKDAKQQLAYAVVAHEYSHKKERTKDRIPLLKQLEGEKAYGELNTAISELASKPGRLGDIARTAQSRAKKSVDIGASKDISEEAPQYFVEGLLTSYDGPLGAARKYVDTAVSAVRSAASKLGIPLDVRPQDLAYIIKQDILSEANGKKMDSKQAGKPPQYSFVYKGSLKGAKEIRQGLGTMDPVYGEETIEVSDKDVSFDAKKFADEGRVAKLGDVWDHPDLYEYYPSLKNLNLVTVPDKEWNAGSFNEGDNSIKISDKIVDQLINPNRLSKVKEKFTRDANMILVHEINHAIQARRGFVERGSNPEVEAERYTKTKVQSNNPIEIAKTQLRATNVGEWAYMANAGEIMARAAQYAYLGQLPDGTKVTSGIDAAKKLADQFAKVIKSEADRKEFFAWFDQNVAGTEQEAKAMAKFSIAENTIKVDGKTRPTTNSKGQPLADSAESARNFWRWFGDSKVVDEQGRPLVVYHGTSADFEEFKPNIGSYGRGIYMTPNGEFAGASYGENGAVMQIYASVKNPYVVEVSDQSAGDFDNLDPKDMSAWLSDNGYDGVFVNLFGDTQTFMAVGPGQIKSVNNNGTWSKEDSRILFSLTDTNFESTAKKTAAALTKGLVPEKAKILVEQTIGVQKLYEAKMNYNIRKLHELANRNGMDWAVVESGWDRMNKQKSLRANTGNKDVDSALGVIRTQIDDMSRQFKTLFSNAGVPLPQRLDEIITGNLGQYISRSYEIDYNKNYGKEYLAAIKNDPKKKADLNNLVKFFNNGMSRELTRASTLSDEQVKDLWDKVIGSGATTVDEKRADLVNFAGNRKMNEITQALVNDVLRIGQGGRLAGFYRGVSRDTSILKSKRDIPVEIRKVWGERTGVAEAAMTTVIRQARLLAETQMQADLLKRAPESFSDKATTDLSERISTSVDKYGPLAGKYTSPEMKRFLEMRSEQYESEDAFLFDVHSVATQDRAVANAAAKVLRQWRKGIGTFKAFTVLGEPINYLYNVGGMAQALMFKAPKDWSYTDSKGNKTNFKDWAGQFAKDLTLGEVGPETSDLYQQMVKYGLIGSALAGDIQEAFVRELRGNKSWTKTNFEKAGHAFNVVFGGPEIVSTGIVLANEANFLRDLWTAQGKKFTFDQLMQEAADRTKKTTINRDRAFRFAKAMDAYGASTYLTFFSETFRAPITNIVMAYKMTQEAKTMNPEAAKIANAYATRQFIAGAGMLAATYAMLHGLATVLGRGFGEEDDEREEALPEGMRTNVDNLVVLGEDSAGAKYLYDTSMTNTYSALMNPLANIARGKFEEAGKELLDLQFVNPLIRQGVRAANGELGPSEGKIPAGVNEAIAWMGLSDYVTPGMVARIPQLGAGVEPSIIQPTVDILTGKKNAQDFGGGMGAFLSLIGARPYRYSPQQAARNKINDVSEQYKESVKSLNEVIRNRNSGKETIRSAVDRFYDEEYRMIQEAIPVIEAAKASGMDVKVLQQLMAPSGLKQSVRESLLTGKYRPSTQARNWLEISALSKIIQLPRNQQEEILEGYRRNRELFDEIYKLKFEPKGVN